MRSTDTAVVWINHSPCKPGVIPGFSSMCNETLICGPHLHMTFLFRWDIKHKTNPQGQTLGKNIQMHIPYVIYQMS